MPNGLKSDLGLANEHRNNLLSASTNLSELPTVGEGNTNHDVNTECMNAYTGIRENLSSYLEQAAIDAERIGKLGLYFTDVDHQLSSEIGN